MNRTLHSYQPTFMQEACRWLYSCLLVLLIPFVAVAMVLRGKGQNQPSGHTAFERLGVAPKPASPQGYLFHCVSVGEVVAASGLIKRIMQEEPDVAVTVTTTTLTGSARVNEIFGSRVNHCYLPFDLPICMSILLSRLSPRMVVITEVELWPNFIHTCWRNNIPVLVVNARMTDRSARRYKKFASLFTPMLNKVAHVCAQGQRDYDNYLLLGIPADNLTLTNNIKFDQAALQSVPFPSSFMNVSSATRPIIVGGSTHEPEESILLQASHNLRKKFPDLLLVLVPRHPERFGEVARLIKQKGAAFVKSSENDSVPKDCSVVLVDEMGRLNHVYQNASIAFVGGSIAERGGHNALEPAAAGLPVLMGPSRHNNPEICHHLEQQGALILARDSEDISAQCEQWLSKPQLAIQCGESGRKVISDNAGATDKALRCIRACFSKESIS